MTTSDSALAGTFVTSRGFAWGTGLTVGIGGVVGAAAGAAVDKRTAAPSPLNRGDLAYLAVMPESVALFKAKRGALKPKVTDELLAEVPRSELQASRYDKGKMVGVFELQFSDGSSWAFDVGRAFAKSATEVATALGAHTE
jgi:hypothetical protein